jgi:hypothetical protein
MPACDPLQGVVLDEGFLQRMQFAFFASLRW